MKRLLLLLSIMLTVTTALQGQEIKGRAITGKGEPIANANVVLQSTDAKCLGVETTKEDGCFIFYHNADTFHLVVHHLAFHSRELICTQGNVGDIILEPNEIVLGDIVISSERPLVKIEEGKMAYDLELFTKDKVANNTYEALTKLPGVREDEERLTLVGANGLTVIINGKPSTMTQEQVTALLKSTPIERVEKVEVMYSAPPQYHVHGAAINIVLKRDTQYSLQGEAGATYRNKLHNEGDAHLFLRLATPKQAFDIMYSANRIEDAQDVDMQSIHTLNGKVHNIRQLQEMRGKAWLHSTRASYECYFNDKNSITAAYNGQYKSDCKGHSRSTGNFQESDNLKEVTKDAMHNFSLQAMLEFGLSAGADYTLYENCNRQTMKIDYLNGNILGMKQDAGQKVRAFHAYADQSHTIGNGWKLGYGISYRNNKSKDFQKFLTESTIKGNDVNSSLSEHTGEAYLSVSRQTMGGLSFSLSVTGEYYRLNGRERWTAYPQASLTYMRNPDHILQGTLDVTKQYPSYWQMQEAVNYIDGYAELHNTPGLEPSKRYSMNANYIFRQKYVFGAFLNYTDKMFAQAMYQSSERLALIYQTHNWDYISQSGVMAVVPFKPAVWFSTNATIVGVYVTQRCDNFFDIGFKDNQWIGMFMLDNSFSVNKDLVFELKGFMQTPATQGTFNIETMWSLSAGAKWNFAKGNGTISCYCNDIFNSTIGDMKMNYKGQNLINRNNFHTRNLTLALTYRFGGYKKKDGKTVDTSRFGH
ncbi:MAG: TonB-dependent receptor family protein [Bacteroidaceae bacterium]|nr:TonB-dependent receptor family protein [Bacteroidaceae bacterium]